MHQPADRGLQAADVTASPHRARTCIRPGRCGVRTPSVTCTPPRLQPPVRLYRTQESTVPIMASPASIAARTSSAFSYIHFTLRAEKYVLKGRPVMPRSASLPCLRSSSWLICLQRVRAGHLWDRSAQKRWPHDGVCNAVRVHVLHLFGCTPLGHTASTTCEHERHAPRTGVQPYDGVVARSAGAAPPDEGSLALVCDSDSFHFDVLSGICSCLHTEDRLNGAAAAAQQSTCLGMVWRVELTSACKKCNAKAESYESI